MVSAGTALTCGPPTVVTARGTRAFTRAAIRAALWIEIVVAEKPTWSGASETEPTGRSARVADSQLGAPVSRGVSGREHAERVRQPLDVAAERPIFEERGHEAADRVVGRARPRGERLAADQVDRLGGGEELDRDDAAAVVEQAARLSDGHRAHADDVLVVGVGGDRAEARRMREHGVP